MVTRRNFMVPRSVFVCPKSGSYLQVQWCGLGGTPFYVRVLNPARAQELFEVLIASPDVEGVSMYRKGKFVGARDGRGS